MVRAALAAVGAVVLILSQNTTSSSAATDRDVEKDRKPQVAMRVSPAISFSPSRVVVTAELRGGANDFEAYYCPAVEWDWGDGTRSEAENDCAPYEAGKSEIKRRYVAEHVFNFPGRYRVQLRLKRNDKVVLATNTTVQVRPGIRDGFGR